MNVEHQVLEVSVHTSQGVNSDLLVRKKMVKLNNSYRNGFKFLRF